MGTSRIHCSVRTPCVQMPTACGYAAVAISTDGTAPLFTIRCVICSIGEVDDQKRTAHGAEDAEDAERLLDGALASLAGVEHGDAELDDLVGEENRLVALWVRGREGTDCPGGAIRWFRGRFCRERCRRGRIARRTSRP